MDNTPTISKKKKIADSENAIRGSFFSTASLNIPKTSIEVIQRSCRKLIADYAAFLKLAGKSLHCLQKTHILTRNGTMPVLRPEDLNSEAATLGLSEVLYCTVEEKGKFLRIIVLNLKLPFRLSL